MNWFLETARIGFRRFEAADLDDVVALDADPEVMRFINGGVAVPRALTERDFGPKLCEAWDPLCARDRRTFYAACAPSDGEFLGWFHMKPGFYWPAELELGYRLKRAAWGRGLATEGAGALRDLAFGRLGLDRLFGATMLGNERSAHVLEKIGMSLECAYVEERWPGEDRRALKFSMRRGAPAPAPARP